jgi:hypothetical protein
MDHVRFETTDGKGGGSSRRGLEEDDGRDGPLLPSYPPLGFVGFVTVWLVVG